MRCERKKGTKCEGKKKQNKSLGIFKQFINLSVVEMIRVYRVIQNILLKLISLTSFLL